MSYGSGSADPLFWITNLDVGGKFEIYYGHGRIRILRGHWKNHYRLVFTVLVFNINIERFLNLLTFFDEIGRLRSREANYLRIHRTWIWKSNLLIISDGVRQVSDVAL